MGFHSSEGNVVQQSATKKILQRVSLCRFANRQKWFSGEELDVKAIMDTWTLQEGFPLVTVEVRGREVRVSQERYIKTDDPSLTEG